MPSVTKVLVLGASGRQGGAAARHLLARGIGVRAFTRHPDQAAIAALRERGAEVAVGDLDDLESVGRALEGVDAVFSVQTFVGHGPEGEMRQGKAVGDLARRAGVRHVVYSSVGGAERQSGVPHFESKWAIEEHLRALGLGLTVLRPAYFMENLERAVTPDAATGELVFRLALPPDRPLQMVAVDDIGAFAAMAFAEPERWTGVALELAGDERTGPEVAAAIAAALGRPARFDSQPLDAVAAFSAEMARMLTWFRDHGYRADIAALRRLRPELLDLPAWLALRQTAW